MLCDLSFRQGDLPGDGDVWICLGIGMSRSPEQAGHHSCLEVQERCASDHCGEVRVPLFPVYMGSDLDPLAPWMLPNRRCDPLPWHNVPVTRWWGRDLPCSFSENSYLSCLARVGKGLAGGRGMQALGESSLVWVGNGIEAGRNPPSGQCQPCTGGEGIPGPGGSLGSGDDQQASCLSGDTLHLGKDLTQGGRCVRVACGRCRVG